MLNLAMFKKQDLPEFYGVTICLLDGSSTSYECVGHTYLLDGKIFELVLRDDLFVNIPVSAILRIEFDKQFSKLLAKRKELMAKKEI